MTPTVRMQNGYEGIPNVESPEPVARRGASRHVFSPPGPASVAEGTATTPLLPSEERV